MENSRLSVTPQAPGAAREPARQARWLVRSLWILVILMSALLALRLWVLTPYRIPTGSMAPTLRGDDMESGVEGDTVVVAKLAYLLSGPRRWDLVAFRSVDDDPSELVDLVKRVVGLPGERLRLDREGVWVDGRFVPLPESLSHLSYVPRGRHGTGEIELGPDEYFVLGDNSRVSQDSRHWGPLAAEKIFGRVVAIVQPWERARWLAVEDGGTLRAAPVEEEPK